MYFNFASSSFPLTQKAKEQNFKAEATLTTKKLITEECFWLSVTMPHKAA